VSGTSWAVIWLQGASGASNAVSLAMAGRTVGSGTSATQGPISIPYDTTLVTNGAQTLTAAVRDETGNTGASSVAVTVSNGAMAPPLSAIITAPAAGATVSGTTTVTMAASGGTGSGYTYALALDGAPLASGTATSYAWDTFTASNASHTLTLTVQDSAGTSATTTRTVTVGNFVRAPSAPPLTATIVAPVAGAVLNGVTTVTMQASGGTGPYVYTLALDGVTLVSSDATGYAWNTVTASNATHTLSLTVRDAAGAAATVSETVQVSNSKVPPKRGPKLSRTNKN
jgi:hypothetical protein